MPCDPPVIRTRRSFRPKSIVDSLHVRAGRARPSSANIKRRKSGKPATCGDEPGHDSGAPSGFGLTPLSQLEEKSEWDQGVWCRGLHYMALVGARVSFPGAVIRGGGCGGRSRLSCLSKSFWSALSSV